MERLPKDIIEKIIYDFTPNELILFSKCKYKNVQRLCSSDEFWHRRLQKDFDILLIYFSKYPKRKNYENYKKLYLNFFTKLSVTADILSEEVLNFYGPVKKFLNSEYRKLLYNIFYKHLLKSVESLILNYSHLFDDNFSEDYINSDLYSLIKEVLPETMSYYDLPDHWEDTLGATYRHFIKVIFRFLGGKMTNFS